MISSTSGVLAFFLVLATIAASTYRNNLRHKATVIESASEDQRGELVLAALESFRVKTENLTKEQQYKLAHSQIRARVKRYTISAIVVAFGATLACTVAIISILRGESVQNMQREDARTDVRVVDVSTEFDFKSLKDASTAVLDIKLKNSGNDSAFLKRIEFVFKPGNVGNTGCNPVPSTMYHYTLTASVNRQTVDISPTFEEAGKVPWTAPAFSIVFNNDNGGELPDLSSDYDQKYQQQWEKAIAELREKFNETPTAEELEKRPNEIVYFLRERSILDAEILQIRTKRSDPLRISQVVPPHGVDRIKIQFTIPFYYFGPCAEVFSFDGYAKIHYDEDQFIRTKPFTLVFSIFRNGTEGDELNVDVEGTVDQAASPGAERP